MPAFGSVRSRLLAPVLLASVPIAALVIYGSLEAHSMAIKNAERELQSVLKLAADEIRTTMTGADQFLGALAQAPSVQRADAKSCQQLLTTLHKEHRAYANLFVATPDGSVVCSAVPSPKPINIKDREYFIGALKTGKTTIGRPNIGRFVRRAVIPIVHPIRNERGQTISIVGGAVDLATFGNRFAQEATNRSGLTFTVRDRDDTILARFPDNDRWAGSDHANAPVTKAIRALRKAGVAEAIGVDGVNRIHAFLPVFEGRLEELWLIAAVDKAELLAEIDAAFIRDMLLLVLIVTIAGIGAWTLGDVAIRHPVAALLHATQRICRRDYQARYGGAYPGGELGVLARSFDEMASTMQQHVSDIQHAREELMRRNRTLKTLSECNQALIRANTEVELMQRICKLIVEHGEYALAYVCATDASGKLQLVAHAGFDAHALTPDNSLLWRSPATAALTRREYIIVTDPAHDGLLRTRGPNHRELWKASVTLPLFAADAVIGTISIYSESTDRFDGAEIDLLAELADDLAYGMNNLRIRVARAQAAEEILRLNSELEQRVQERTAQLEATNRELESFSYSVSHDLRAPLRAIDGFSMILEEDYAPTFDDEGRRLLAVVRNNSQKMGQLIDDLLAFSRLGREPVVAVDFDMQKLVEDVLTELRAQKQDHWPTIEIEPMPIARGDRSLLRQVWVNLLSNAIKFTRATTEPRIKIGGEGEAHERRYYVRDNGSGFDMRYYDKLFGVFQRLHSADEYPGTGVGLAIVHRVVTRHGGRVWAESKVGAGATFYFSLPSGVNHG